MLRDVSAGSRRSLRLRHAGPRKPGGLGELVTDGVTGLLFNPADATDLAAKIAWAESHPERMLEMGRAARAVYEAKYTPERNYRILMDIYEEAIAAVHGVRDAA